jgi:23S rRNA pseudouridine1911/1915/1917 synthase
MDTEPDTESGENIEPYPLQEGEGTPENPISVTVESRAHGWRLDHYLSRLYPNFSRSLLQKAIDEGQITVNALHVKSGRRLRVNDRVTVILPTRPDTTINPEPIPLDVMYEDDVLVIINKPAGLIVHPGRGNYSGTLANALQFHFDHLSDIAGQHRPGIVHRLDRDTTGVLVVAKDNRVHAMLSSQFEERTVKKEYHAIVRGVLEFDSDYIETYIKTDPRIREKMTVCGPGGDARQAITYYEVIERFKKFTYVRLFPHTGRTHQLRVHMLHLRHPIVADRVYTNHHALTVEEICRGVNVPFEAERDDILIKRQALHARRLEFKHPVLDKTLVFEAPIPEDMERTLEALRKHQGS